MQAQLEALSKKSEVQLIMLTAQAFALLCMSAGYCDRHHMYTIKCHLMYDSRTMIQASALLPIAAEICSLLQAILQNT